jgi:hypothetical protein
MKRFYGFVFLALALGPALARAEHATIDLRVMHLDPATGQTREEVSARADQEPPAGGRLPRPLVKVKVGEPLKLQFILVNDYPHGLKKAVRVRYFVVAEEKAGQKNVPDLKQGTVTQGQFTLDFKPKCRVGAQVAFTLPKAGVYLLRVETQNTDSDHEHFAAIDMRAD